MKLKRLLASGLSLALCLSLAAVPAAAATSFPDTETHWAKDYIVEMTKAGLFNGYEDGTFKPDRALTAAEALTLCARVATLSYDLDKDTIQTMLETWQEDLAELLGDSFSWFYDEASIALETGVLTWADLSQRAKAGAMGAPLQKELFSVYLVRAMGLDGVARGLSTYTLEFADASDVTENYAPYVYLLYNYGILTGDQNKNFNPSEAVNRAVSATMLSRVLDYMDKSGLKPELVDYTDYTWKVGTISKVTAGEGSKIELELTNSLSGDKKLNIPASADIYKNDRTAATKDLKSGLYAKICYDEDGDVFAVRLYDTSKFSAASGKIQDLTERTITIDEDGESVTYTLNRFTELSIGDISGDWSILDLQAGYTSATIRHDEADSAVSVQLHGGTRVVEGLLSEVNTVTGGGYTIQLAGFDGVSQRLNLNEDSTVTVNDVEGSLKSSYVGKYAAVRVSNENRSLVASVAVDSLTEYIQGSVKALTYSKTPNSITVSKLSNGKSETYTVPANAKIYYSGAAALLKDAAVGSFVTVKLSADDEAMLISAWPGSVETEGELAGIVYGSETSVLTVNREDGSSAQFSIDMSDLPDVERDGKDSSLARLSTGDNVLVTVRYQKVTHIEATSRSANASGTIETVTHATNSSVLTMKMADGSTQNLTLNDSVSVTQDDKVLKRTSLQPGYRLSMVVSGSEILSVEVESAISSSSKITGTVILVDTSAKEILFELDEGNNNAITVNVDSSTKYNNADGSSFSLKTLKNGDRLTIYGSYKGGDFDADMIVRE